MVKCPQCGAECNLEEATDGRCFICGCFLPAEGKPQVAAEFIPPSEADDETSKPPTDLSDAKAEEPAKGAKPVRPRELSREYARHVTLSWQSTSEFGAPDETINSGAMTSEDSSNLVIGSRSVGNVDDEERADYELKEVIGEGAMGTVWSARQSAINRSVAIKIPKSATTKSTLGRNQFISEVVVTGQLDHPNIVPVYDLARDEETKQLFCSMKHVEGIPWNECIHGKKGAKKLTRDENIEVLMKVCDAIRFAHDRGVIHRDIKPHNIMVGQYGEVSVMDFGISLRVDAKTGESATTKLSPAGTPAYMAPEMAALEYGEIGEATDVYLLGAVLYEIITGRPPHPWCENLTDAVLAAARNEIQPTDERGELVDIAMTAMQTDTEDRYQSVKEFQQAIRDYRSHAESIALAERGEEHLNLAVANGHSSKSSRRFDNYDRARFAFQEAISLWDGNESAKDGLRRTALAYAGYALETRNYARGIDLLDEQEPEHRDLLGKLKRAQRRQNGLYRLRNALISAVFVAVVVISCISWWLYVARNEAVAQTKRAEEAEAAATQAAEVAQTERVKAEKAAIAEKEAAEVAQTEKVKAENAAIAEKKAAEDAKAAQLLAQQEGERAKEAEKDAEIASYGFEIGLADETLKRNAFDRVAEILRTQEENASKAPLRNWEWGSLKYATTRPVMKFEVDGKRLTQRVESAAISHDGKWIVAGTGEGHVYVWNRDRNRKPELTLLQGATTHAVAASNDGRFVASAGFDNGHVVKIWSLPDGVLQPRFPHPAEVLDVAFSADGSKLLTGCADGVARLWSRDDTGRPLHQLKGDERSVHSARFSPDEQRIVTAGEDGTVRVWLAESGKEVQRCDGHEGPVYAAQFSPDGEHIVSGGRDRRLLVWDVSPVRDPDAFRTSRTDAIEQRLRKDSLLTLSLTDAGVKQLGEHAGAIRSISFADDGGTVFSAGHDNTVRVWDFSKRFTDEALVKELRGHSGWVRSCAFFRGQDIGADGKAREWVLSGGYDGRVQLWDWKHFEIARVLREDPERRTIDRNLVSAAHSPDGEWIVTASETGIVTAWDMKDPNKPRAQRLEEGHAALSTTGVVFAFGDGQRLLTAAGDNTAAVWDMRTGKELFKLGTDWFEENGTGWRGVAAVSHDGRWIATGMDQGLAKIWNAHSGEPLAQVTPPNRPVGSELRLVSVGGIAPLDLPDITALAFSQDDQSLFVGDEYGGGYFIEPQSGLVKRRFAGHNKKVTAAIFLPDGRHLLTSSADTTAAKWNVQAGQLVEVFRLPHDGQVVAMDVTADGTQLITACVSQIDEAVVVHLWDVETGQPVKRLPLASIAKRHKLALDGDARQRPIVRSVAFHPTGQHAIVTLFAPRESKYYIGDWGWNNNPDTYREIRRELRDVSMAMYVPDGDAILAVGGRGARLWNPRSQTVTMSFGPQRIVRSASFSHDSQFIACAGADGSVRMAADGSVKTGGTVKFWQLDRATRRWLPAPKLIGSEATAAFNWAVFHPQRNDVILTAGNDGKAQLWKDEDGWKPFLTLDEHSQAVHCAIFSPDGSKVLTASADSVARVWDIQLDTGGKRLVAELRHDAPAPVLACAFSANGKWAVTGSGKEAWIWKTDWQAGSFENICRLEGHTQEVTSVAFSRNNDGPKRLLTASRDFTVKLWDTSTLAEDTIDENSFRELLTLEEHNGEVTTVEFSPNGLNVLTVAKDGQTIIWPSDPVDGKADNSVAVKREWP